jgi:prepilin-type N-terminal cleavage/methylation domain-containing protein/prepilin-type processing-associated H-X9-DG protein
VVSFRQTQMWRAKLQNAGRCRGFSLIELLLVIAIIAILAALLLPSLSSAKARAQRAQCLSNLRQLAVTFQIYPDDNGGALPGNGYVLDPDATRLWVLGSEHLLPSFFINPDYAANPRYAQFADYMKTANIYKCPADRSEATASGVTAPKVRSYSLNSYFGWQSPPGDNPANPAFVSFAKSADFARLRSSDLFTFVDGAPPNLCYSAFVIYMGSSGLFWHRPSIEHRQSGTLAFADGHAEAHRWLDPDTLRAARDGGVGDGAHFTIVKPTNPDLVWLQEHATVRK